MKILRRRLSFLWPITLVWAVNLFAQAPDTLWTKTYGGGNNDLGFSVQQTADSGYIFTGDYGLSIGSWELYLIKTDVSGNALWTKTYGGSGQNEGSAVQQTTDDGYMVAGYTNVFGAGFWDIWLLKTDANGDTTWTKTYGGTDNDRALDAQQTYDGGYIIVGYTYSFGAGGRDLGLLKTDGNGNLTWQVTYGGTNTDWGYAIQQTADSGYIVVGTTRSFGPGGLDIWLLKTDADGDTLWTKTYGGTQDDEGHSAQETFEGGYIVVGKTASFGAGGGDVWILKTDADGDTIWTKTIGGVASDVGSSVQQTFDGGYIIAGHTRSYGAGNSDVYLIKTNPTKLVSPNGGEVWESDSTYNIIWWCEHPMVNYYRILFSSDGGTSFPDTIADNISPDSTSWSWTLPVMNSTTCRVKIQVLDDVYSVVSEDESDSNFTIFDTGIEEYEDIEQTLVNLEVSPNPFSEKTEVKYSVRHNTKNANLKIYDITGKLVRQWDYSTIRLSDYVVWDGRDNLGNKVPSGVYLLKFETGEYTIIEKLLLIR